MKTKKELNDLKEEIVALNQRLSELTNDELVYVIGGTDNFDCPLGLSHPDPQHCSYSTCIYFLAFNTSPENPHYFCRKNRVVF